MTAGFKGRFRQRGLRLLAGVCLWGVSRLVAATVPAAELPPFVLASLDTSASHLPGSRLEGWINAIVLELGYRPEWRFLPGRRLVVELARGNVDADFAREVDLRKESPDILRVSVPYMNYCLVLLGPAPAESAVAPVIAINGGAPAIRRQMAERWPQARPIEYTTMDQALRLLAAGRANYLLLPHSAVSAVMTAAWQPLFIYAVQPPRPIYMHVHRRWQGLVPALEQQFRARVHELAPLSCVPDTLPVTAALPPALR
jgi:hypothetical protein